MNLLIDIGNTRIKWQTRNLDVVGSVSAFTYTLDDIALKLEGCGIRGQQAHVKNIFISNVGGNEIKLKVTRWFVENMDVEPQFAKTHKESHGLFNAYIKPEQLGVDRYLAMLAVPVASLPAVIVDCGTAVTIDSVNAQKEFVGGVILPGLCLMREALSKNTDALEYFDSSKTYSAFALDTQSGILSGSVLAVTSAIEQVVKQFTIEEQVLNDDTGIEGHRVVNNVNCIMTGGDGELICERLGIEAEYQEDLVLKGLSVYFQAG